ncbi:YsnF/AvaK domain-containing protein [Cesiribacter sp. SM1]|uniref:YsnF/AvaK domain-containing protein n=1 Tax=Cesiribacter sp. SM1 TaxID=2861196 RepID=UPI001CD79270|nr:YsnF/AvaK domain-containing protein [Cesiribacter sp. SM1]
MASKDKTYNKAEGQAAEDRVAYQSKTIPVIEEKVKVRKKVVETGSVHISKKVHEDEVDVEVPYVYEDVDVERIAINQYVDTPPPAIRQEGETTIIPVLKEVVVKRLVLVEELHVTKRKVKKQASQHMTLRSEEVSVKRKNSNTSE